jgi:hypothetical protein
MAREAAWHDEEAPAPAPQLPAAPAPQPAASYKHHTKMGLSAKRLRIAIAAAVILLIIGGGAAAGERDLIRLSLRARARARRLFPSQPKLTHQSHLDPPLTTHSHHPVEAHGGCREREVGGRGRRGGGLGHAADAGDAARCRQPRCHAGLMMRHREPVDCKTRDPVEALYLPTTPPATAHLPLPPPPALFLAERLATRPSPRRSPLPPLAVFGFPRASFSFLTHTHTKHSPPPARLARAQVQRLHHHVSPLSRAAQRSGYRGQTNPLVFFPPAPPFFFLPDERRLFPLLPNPQPPPLPPAEILLLPP